MITANEALDTILADDGVQDVPEYIIRRMWPVNGFPDKEALADYISDISAFTFSEGHTIDDVMRLIDLVYDLDSPILQWLVKDISSIKEDYVGKNSAKATTKDIISRLIGLRRKADNIRRNYE